MMGYKVVRINFDYDLSYKSISQMGYAEVSYHEKKEAVPEHGCGPLAVFDSLESAQNFCKLTGLWPDHYRIWLCEYTPSDHKTLWNRFASSNLFPLGTVLADSVTLLSEVTHDWL